LRFAAVVVVALAAASPVAAKGLEATFEPARASVGENVVLRFGDTQLYVAPFRIYLVAVENAQEWRKQSDPSFIALGVHGKAGSVGLPSRFKFVVPDVPPGEYYAAVWFKGYESGRWHNALTYPLLRVEREESATFLIPLTSVAAAFVLLGLVRLWWKRRVRVADSGPGTTRVA